MIIVTKDMRRVITSENTLENKSSANPSAMRW